MRLSRSAPIISRARPANQLFGSGCPGRGGRIRLRPSHVDTRLFTLVGVVRFAGTDVTASLISTRSNCTIRRAEGLESRYRDTERAF